MPRIALDAHRPPNRLHRFLRRPVRFVAIASMLAASFGSPTSLLLSTASGQQTGSEKKVDAEKIIETGELNRFDALSPEDAHRAFEVAPGYRIELVAAEPLVVDPIAFCFDSKGRMIVVEMRGYSERAESHTGRVRRLTDDDGDGRMDRVETLIDGLAWPTAVACWGDGIVVGVAPDFLYVPSPEAGGADNAETWFRGFGTSNVQGLFNSFRWGPDLRLHGATSSSGGEVMADSWDEPLRIGRRDFAIDPTDRSFDIVNGGAQHGMSFGRWGEKFVCSNSDHLQQVLMMTPREGRAGRYSGVPPLRRSIAADGPQADVFRSSPPEPWRILRTHLRVTGKVGGPVEGGGRAAGYFTGATGVHAYIGDQWPESPKPVALVCDVGGNLVHRKHLENDGLWYRGVRIDQESEFIRSPDTWFRPVQLGDGPDGAVYIADMYREVIEHPKSLPPSIKSQVDLNSGNDKGRIWRVVADDRPVRRSLDRPFEAMPVADLVAKLAHTNAWHRRTAARLLVERGDAESIEPLREAARSGVAPETRLEALAVLSRMPDGIDGESRDLALADPHPRVRQRAIAIAADHVDRLGLPSTSRLLTLADDPSIHVRFRLAHDAIVLVPAPALRADVLASIATVTPDDPWIRWAVEGSLGDATDPFLSRIADATGGDVPAGWLEAVAVQTLAEGSVGSIERLIGWIESDDQPTAIRDRLLAAVANQVSGGTTGTLAPLADWTVGHLADEVIARAEKGELRLPGDRGRLRLIGWASPPDAKRLLDQLLRPYQPPELQRTAVETLVGNEAELTRIVVDRIPSLTPPLQAEAWRVLGTTRAGLTTVAAAIDSEKVSADELPAELIETMGRSKDAKIRESVQNVEPRKGVPAETVGRYTAALQQPADVKAGKTTFDRVCAVCHQPEEGARPVGPPLKSVVEKSPAQILQAILDPNLEVDPKYFLVQVVTVSGQVVSGILAEESEQSLIILDSQAKPHVIARDDIESLQTSKRSLMPENLAAEISETQMRDLIGYLKSSL